MPQIAHGSDPGKAIPLSFVPVRPDQGDCQEPQGNDYSGAVCYAAVSRSGLLTGL